MLKIYEATCVAFFWLVASNQASADDIIVRQSGHAVLSSKDVANHALPYAQLANAVQSGANVGSWKVVDTWQNLLNPGIFKAISSAMGSASGFNALVYHNSDTGENCLVFEGTHSLSDVVTDVLNVAGSQTTQYDLAAEVAKNAAARYGSSLVLDGHSLGGGLAQYAATQTNLRAVTFNAAGIPATWHSFNLGDRLLNINVGGDSVSGVSGQIGTEYVLRENTGFLSHTMVHVLDTLVKAANQKEIGSHVNWASVAIARSNMAAIVSGNVSATGSAGGTVMSGAKSQAVASGLFVGNTALAETEWTLTAGDPAIHLGQGKSYGHIVAYNNDGSTIYSLNNAHVATTSIEKTFAVGPGGAKVSLSGLADFVTTEFPTFIGSEFNDNATVRLITQNGRSVTLTSKQLFGAAVNDGAIDGVSHTLTPVSNLPSPLAGYNENDGGGHTGWRLMNVKNLSVAAGGTLKIVVSVNNVGDTAVPSAILLNKIQAK